jgi:cytidine deaminase
MADSCGIFRNQISVAAFRAAESLVVRDARVSQPEVQPWVIENRLSLSEEQLAVVCMLLDNARYQQRFSSSPLLSQFRVGSSALCNPGGLAVGANCEYGAGFGRAYDEVIHSEESLVAHALGQFGQAARLSVIGLAFDSPSPATPCGKCRSLIESYSAGDPVIVSVGRELGVQMWTLSELLPRVFQPVNRADLSVVEASVVSKLFDAALNVVGLSFNHFSSQTLGESGAAVAASGRVFALPRIDSLAFYGTSALRATLAATLGGQPKQLDAVLLCSKSGLPTGEDRQLLFEFASLFDQESTLPTYLYASESDTLSVTTPHALLPDAFGPRDLGMRF